MGILCLIASAFSAGAAWRRRPLVAGGVSAEFAPEGAAYVHLEPGEFAGTLLLGGMRGLVADLLWMRALNAKDHGRFYESVAVFGLIARVQPHFPVVWEYMAHDMALNIAREMDDPQEEWNWYLTGIEASLRGIGRNPESGRLLRHLAFLLYRKGEDHLERVEMHDWSRLLNPLFSRFVPAVEPIPVSRVVAVAGDHLELAAGLDLEPGSPVLVIDAQQVHRGIVQDAAAGAQRTVALADPDVQVAPGARVVPSMTPSRLGVKLFRCDLVLRRARGDRMASRAYIRRFVPILMGRDGYRLRNRGRHLAALRQLVAALREWQIVAAWSDDPAIGFTEIEAAQHEQSRRAHMPDLRRSIRRLIEALAPDQARALAALDALAAGELAALEDLLAQPGWRTQLPGSGRGVWYDEE
ncbi:MAG: hypothetical protein ACOCYP_05130 [Planctomycetota bacterium]